MKQATADGVRQFVSKHYIEPARKVGQQQITIRAGNVHSHMGLTDRMPLVCSSIQADKFAADCRVNLVGCKGPNPGANLWLTFEVLP